MDKPLNQTTSNYNDRRRFMSDTQKIVHRHLRDRNHVITDEELRNIRVGMMLLPEPENTNTYKEDRQRNGDSDPAGIPSNQSSVEP